ncbi:hypothetical protein AGMMS49975_18630 [Clostridia bacterium]|nr:hypothetical protein AGMMS49975_18630 [Clostridia bacterium]
MTAKEMFEYTANGINSQKYRVAQAWYSGDPNALRSSAEHGSFWKSSNRRKIHAPVAAELAGASADLLFGDAPNMYVGIKEDTPKRFQYIIDKNNISSLLCSAAEICAAYGDVYLKVNWDKELADYPILSIVPPQNAYVAYKQGIAVEYYFLSFEQRTANGDGIWTFERYSKGEILEQTYDGSISRLGAMTSEDENKTGIDEILAVHIPNAIPDNLTGSLNFGNSDITEVVSLLDALDETYSSWIRDVRLAKARIIVPMEYMRLKPDILNPNQRVFEFDKEDDTYVAMDIDSSQVTSPITVSQFSIRAEEHEKTCAELLNRIVSSVGYAPQTFGIDIAGNAQSGTALSLRLDKTLKTKAKKETYWKQRLEVFLSAVLKLDNVLFKQKHAETAVSVEIKGNKNYLMGISETINQLNQAAAVSIYTKVQLVHPDWDDTQILKEEHRIKLEQNITVENTDDETY